MRSLSVRMVSRIWSVAWVMTPGTRCARSPFIVYVLPDPVCPYAKIVPLNPSNTDSTTCVQLRSQKLAAAQSTRARANHRRDFGVYLIGCGRLIEDTVKRPRLRGFPPGHAVPCCSAGKGRSKLIADDFPRLCGETPGLARIPARRAGSKRPGNPVSIRRAAQRGRTVRSVACSARPP